MYSVENANKHIKLHKYNVIERFRPQYHITAPIGWINDPNGFCYYKGEYHLFCQYYPYDQVWGTMHWGHWTSKDLVKWDWRGVALAPDKSFDNLGCFSGTALVLDEKMYIMYTGVHKNEEGIVVQEQCLAISDDGYTFNKYSNNPVVSSSDLPDGFSKTDFRDPKLLKTESGFRILVASSKDDVGKILSYKSQNLINWKFDKVFVDNISTMPECPDYYRLNNKDIFVTCLMNQPMQGLKYQNDHHAVVYFIGEEKNGVLALDKHHSIDLGQDFYAPQTLITPSGRAVMIAWMQMWGEAPANYYLKHGWQGQYTFPREITIKNNRIYQKPIKEIESLYKDTIEISSIKIKEKTSFDNVSGGVLRLQIEIINITSNDVVVYFFENKSSYIILKYERDSGILSLDRSNSYYPVLALPDGDAKNIAKVQIDQYLDSLNLDVLLDTCSIEVFAENGKAALTSLVYPDESSDKISFKGEFTIEKLILHRI